MRTSSALALAAFALAGLLTLRPASAGLFGTTYHRTIDTRYDVAGTSRVQITAASGDLDVTPVPGNGPMRIVGTISASSQQAVDDVGIHGTREGGTYVIRIDERVHNGWFSRFSSRYAVTVPQSLALDLRDASGDVTVHEPRENLRVHDASGDVRVENAHASIDLHTASGDVTASVTDPWSGSSIALSSASGDLHLVLPPNFRGTLHTHTADGDVNSRAALAGGPTPITLTTASGDITIHS